MATSIPVSYATFVAQFPEFDEVAPAVVNAALVRAANHVAPNVWREKAQDGMMYLAADFLATSPLGMNTKLLPKDGGMSTYRTQYEKMLLEVAGGFVVAGGCRTARW